MYRVQERRREARKHTYDARRTSTSWEQLLSGSYLEIIIRCKPADTLPNNKWLDFESDYSLTPILMTQDDPSADCVAATACRCKEGGHHCRTGHCSCQKSRVRCTRACLCGDWCSNPCNDEDSDWYNCPKPYVVYNVRWLCTVHRQLPDNPWL